MRRRANTMRVPGAARHEAQRSGALQTRDRFSPWRSRISGAPLHFVARCSASGTRSIGRRDFISLIGGAAVAWPLAAQAQKPAMPVIGFLSSLAPSDLNLVVPAFREGLNGTGFVEGRNIAIEYRWAEGDYQRLPTLSADLVRRRVAAIAAISGTPAALAAKAATTTIPIVFAIGGDPIAPGLVTSLSRPGGNITGVSFYSSPIVTKRLDLARELIATRTMIGMLVNPDNPPTVREGTAVQEAAAAVAQPLQILHASTQRDIDDAFATIEQRRIGALLVSPDPFFFTERIKLVVLMARHALPTIFADREQAEAGGLMSYGASRLDAYRQAGNYVGRIVKGEKPAELPVVLPTKFHLVINLKTAKSLRIDIPAAVLARADEVIE
jgi:putative tryptophan/tyrosine transport system substrate-binding protein